jgi:uncharacterized phiE125 gp8 family phage protein
MAEHARALAVRSALVNRCNEEGRNMSLALIAGPAEEPLSLADAKAFARIEVTDDDALVQALIVAARLKIEASTRRFLVTQSWRLKLSTASLGRIVRVPVAPVQSVTTVRWRDPSGATTTLDPSAYQADLAALPPLVTLLAAAPATGSVEIDMVMGYGAAAAVPEPLRHAVRLLVATWYEDRGFLAMTGPEAPWPAGVEALLSPYRGLTLRSVA